MGTLTPVDIRNFSGMNIREKPSVIEDDELVSCVNFDIGRSGELVKRQGVTRLHNGEHLGSSPVTLLGHFLTDSVSYLMGVSNGIVYYSSDGVTWTSLITANAQYGVQYVNKFYMVRTDGLMIEWDPSGTSQLLLPEERDFEQDVLEGWSINANLSALEVDTAEARSGNNSMKMTAAGAGNASAISRKITAQPGYQVTFSFYAKASFAKTIRAYVNYYNSSDTQVGTTNATTSTSAGTYVLLSVASATAPANTAYARLIIQLDGAAGSDVLNIDDVSAVLGAGIPRLVDGSPQGTAAIVFKDRLWVVNSNGIGSVNSRLYFSEIADFGDWPSINFIDVQPGEGDFLTALAVIQDILIVFKTESIWALYVQGAPANWNLRIMSPEIGCVSKYTPREIEGFLYFVGRRGVYRTDGNVFEDLSENLSPIFDERVVNISTANKDSASWWEDRYVLLFYPTPSTIRYFVFHLRKGGWTEWTFPSGTSPASFLEITVASPQKGLYAGSINNDGKVFRFGDDVYQDEGISFTCSLRTKEFDLNSPATMKRMLWLSAEHEGQGSVSYEHWAEQAMINTDSVAGQAKKRAFKVKGVGYFRSWQLYVEHTDAYPFVLYGFTAMVIPKRTLVDVT